MGSQEMLAYAQQKAYEAHLPIRFFHQRMERLNLGGSVDCCVCALDSLNHITESKNLRPRPDAGRGASSVRRGISV